MTTSQEEGREILKKIYEDKKAYNKKNELRVLDMYNRDKIGDAPEAKAFHALSVYSFRTFVDLYDSIERLTLTTSEAIELMNKRLGDVEKSVKELGGQINNDNIIAVAKFAEEFQKQIEESKRNAEVYKRKMMENDLAT
jgi:hypothetical protein